MDQNAIQTTDDAETERELYAIGERARTSARHMALADPGRKNTALEAIAEALNDGRDTIKAANVRDLDAGRHTLDDAALDRLAIGDDTIKRMADGLRQVAALPDPIGAINDLTYQPSGIQVGQMRVPLGVIGIIYESRPNVTVDAAALCIKSGNAAILRGGSEAINTNLAIAACVARGLAEADLPETAVQAIETTDRAAVGAMLADAEHIDVIVPRGGKSLTQRVANNAQMPVIKHLDGVCHVYIDADADLDKAVAIAVNAKTQRFGTCNTMETLLVAASIAPAVLPRLAHEFEQAGITLVGCERACAASDAIETAAASDWGAEFLGPKLAIGVVDDLTSAVDHIAAYGSAHTDAIVTENWSTARYFTRAVDSASVMVNASTRFSDGFEYGLGAEIGVSTDKLHARGPVGLLGLTSEKYVVYGDGHLR
ncbi:glutamate-5-semialdehyde dehydrogenase [Salinisphaera sp. USBA-960]|uniref:glutamate-5-semialdehyde dehydrogenase n=1 Tax=Salinisphaera orenii TaxID=856731 RepID=UPI000DBE4DBB|nr:glutamate-5-semialdehyde dehydrogenase [Salifodinibacter halophilus]NNC25563.1 glutamate-5-semialdehyde dehydrogenase [Salifodinibacter halophilus]